MQKVEGVLEVAVIPTEGSMSDKNTNTRKELPMPTSYLDQKNLNDSRHLPMSSYNKDNEFFYHKNLIKWQFKCLLPLHSESCDLTGCIQKIQ